MRVPTLDLKAQYDTIREDILTAATKVFDSQGFILGKTVQDFEAACAEYTTAKHAVGVSSGTDAILIALMNEGIGHGDEVITTTFSFFATAGTIARTGATPVFVDIDPRTFNIDPALIEAKITPKTKAIVPVHLYGLPADMDPINAIAKKHNLIVIEDAAQAIGAHDDQGRQVGTLGDYGCFSFFPSKNLGGAGDAGMTTTMDDARAEKLFKMRMHGEVRQYVHTFVGGNFRIDALQAAILHVKLPHLDSWTEGRQRNADTYRELLSERGVLLGDTVEPVEGKGGVVTPFVPEGYRHIYHQFVLRADRRDELMAFLNEREIGARIYYPIPLHQQECFADLSYKTGDMPVAEQLAKEVLALPVYPEMTPEMLVYVADQVAQFYGK
ncbi:DegT/DnrJ/EryC1/StrS family aminotransferase [bacterium]|nr:DegT/DnrJ/EryC1/StrS family aminotransferase [bacterium]